VRIPLDYYRILGLPIQATAEQLQQAHRDRTLQLPRREFSEAAIAARKQLLDEAYAALSNTDKRRAYDASFLTKVYDADVDRSETSSNGGALGGGALGGGALGAIRPAAQTSTIATDPTLDPYAPSIDIHDAQLVGALLILLELGEYELVLKLGHPYLTNSAFSGGAGRSGQVDVTRSDIVLTVAFAYLELGREQWLQGQYETAAESLEAGQELLLREGVFSSVRSEIQSDLYKLRPYRVLELLALPEIHEIERGQGINLLRDMLRDRGGIDGTGEDHSGLNVDDFLRFIQQLRGYLTAAEQHALFEVEARRPSAVATYLAVYALLARGFAYRQPALIRRAKLMLSRLGTRQDVYLEQAICALLLGQTEEASRALDQSQEYESLTFIREHSQGSPDLLPGLCLYGERWLQNEVFPHFRDLAQQYASLKDYFADEQVQVYLEELPNEPDPSTSPQREAAAPSGLTAGYSTAGRSEALNGSRTGRYEQRSGQPSFAANAATAITETSSTRSNRGTSAMPTAERVSQLSPEGRLNGAAAGSGRSRSAASSPSNTSLRRSSSSPSSIFSSSSRGSGGQSIKGDRLMFLIAMAGLGLLLFWLLFNWLTKSVFGGPTLKGEQLQVSLAQSAVPIPDPTASVVASPNAPLTPEVGKTLIETWLKAKAAAMGRSHDSSQLSQILTDPILAERLALAEETRQNGIAYDYRHTVQDVRLLPAAAGTTVPTEAQVDASVTESVSVYENGSASAPETQQLYLRYYLLRQNEQWRIKDIQEVSPTGATSTGELSSPDGLSTPGSGSVSPGSAAPGSVSPGSVSPGIAPGTVPGAAPGTVPGSVPDNNSAIPDASGQLPTSSNSTFGANIAPP
jgi:ARC6-like, IMS domain/DnaJ domain